MSKIHIFNLQSDNFQELTQAESEKIKGGITKNELYGTTTGAILGAVFSAPAAVAAITIGTAIVLYSAANSPTSSSDLGNISDMTAA